MMISIDTIHDNPENARRVETTFADDDFLAASLAALGMLQPVLVCRHPDKPGEWMIRAGHRRVRAARRLKWTLVPAVEEGTEASYAPETAVSAAENMVRRSMHPIDQWRAISDLQKANSGYSLEQAAAVCGVSKALAQRMSVLGCMDESVLEELAKQPELPQMQALRTISAAPAELQRTAMGRANRDREGVIYWHEVANLCSIKKIPMDRAIFDTTLIAWDEDFFAQADAGDRFTTKDIDAFMEAQRGAIKAQIDKSNGRYVLSEHNRMGSSGDVKLPSGWARDYGTIPKRFGKDDPRKVYVALNAEGDWRLGMVDYAMAAPSRHTAASSDDSLPDDDEIAPKSPIGKTTLELLAKMKADAVRERLRVFKDNGAADMLRALLMLFTMNNVSAGRFKGSAHNPIAQSLVMPDGQPRDDVEEEDLCSLAAWVIEGAIEFDHPKSFNGPGKGAEWLAVAIGAEMPRTDTKEVLRGISAAKLEEIAPQQCLSMLPGKTGVRKALVGKMPNFRIVDFGAPGPVLPEDDDEREAAE
jgi:ParB/RepB/Spo0J family partition protein